MNNRWSVLGIPLAALAVLVILLLSGGWPGWGHGWGMMGPWMMGNWGYGMMGPGWGLGLVLAWALLGAFLAALVIWAAGKKK